MFRDEIVPRLRSLVACDSLGYNEIDLEHGTAMAVTDVPLFEGIDQRFLDLAHQHPLVARHDSGDQRALRLSDFLTEAQFHHLELYHDLCKLLETEDQIAFGLPGEVLIAVLLNRSRRTFTDRDCQVLELVRPALALAHAQACERERVRALTEALESGLAERHAAVIQLDRGGAILHASAHAIELLDAYFGRSQGNGPRLPPALATLAASKAGPDELTVDGARGRLRA